MLTCICHATVRFPCGTSQLISTDDDQNMCTHVYTDNHKPEYKPHTHALAGNDSRVV